jgi:hypothetical protein
VIRFAAPWLLAGLAAAAVPLILHLVARREPPSVPFPAVRYLEETARRHQRRLHLQHWLLLAIRTLLIIVIVLAAAGPSRAGTGPGAHAPTALVLVLDNSLSAAAVRGGTATLDLLREAAARVFDRATAADRLWLVTAGQPAIAGDPAMLRHLVDSLAPVPVRMDLGEVIRLADDLLATTALPGEILVLTDLQRTAVSEAEARSPLAVGVPDLPPPANLGVAEPGTGTQPWLAGGLVAVSVHGDQPDGAPVSIRLGERVVRQGWVESGAVLSVAVTPRGPGWYPVEVRLDPDELRLDDVGVTAVRVAPPAAVTWPGGDRYLGLAAEVLLENGRIGRGSEIVLGSLGPAASVVLPPEDPAGLGALNRALQARGIPWSYDALAPAAARTDSTAVLESVGVSRRYRLRPSGELGEVLVTAAGEPWMVREGKVVLLGSRLDPAWTDLPLRAAFLPFMDLLLNRLARGGLPVLHAVPGSDVSLPGQVTRVLAPAGPTAVESGGHYRPLGTGLHWLMHGADTAGVLAVNPDPRESLLAPAGAAEVAALWPGALVAPATRAAGLAFARHARADLRGPLLGLALALALADLLLGAGTRRRRA